MRIAAQIAGSEGMEMEERLHYHDQMISTLSTLNAKVTCTKMTEREKNIPIEKEEKVQLHAEDVLDFVSCTLEREGGPEEQVVPGKELTFLLVVNSRLPRALSCSALQVSPLKLWTF